MGQCGLARLDKKVVKFAVCFCLEFRLIDVNKCSSHFVMPWAYTWQYVHTAVKTKRGAMDAQVKLHANFVLGPSIGNLIRKSENFTYACLHVIPTSHVSRWSLLWWSFLRRRGRNTKLDFTSMLAGGINAFFHIWYWNKLDVTTCVIFDRRVRQSICEVSIARDSQYLWKWCPRWIMRH